MVHEFCEGRGLFGDSKGEGNQRALTIYRNRETPQKKKRIDKLPKGISEILPDFLYQGSARDAEDVQGLLVFLN